MLSIVIPTFNEEKYLPLLLKSIKRQGFYDFEVIIADAGSEDGTLDVAKSYGCRIVEGGLPAKGRNEGAKAAKGDLLLFLDADTVLPRDFFKKAVSEFRAKKINFGAFILLPYPKNKVSYFMFNNFYNKQTSFFEKFSPHAGGAVMIKKEIFERLNGYDESIKLAEDHDLAKRAKKIAKFRFLKSTKVFVSDRRFRRDGWSNTIAKYIFCEFHMALFGPIKSDILKYEFGRYNDYIEEK
ncbi:MAG: glycosyltransferase [Candidatus Staskawiczbacteria bacterium]|nr:glycosyltransferase [Candidatus Staskawiczbacteria bacterium]